MPPRPPGGLKRRTSSSLCMRRSDGVVGWWESQMQSVSLSALNHEVKSDLGLGRGGAWRIVVGSRDNNQAHGLP